MNMNLLMIIVTILSLLSAIIINKDKTDLIDDIFTGIFLTFVVLFSISGNITFLICNLLMAISKQYPRLKRFVLKEVK